MVRTAITPQVITRGEGITPTYEAGNIDGHSFMNTDIGIRWIEIKNTTEAPLTVTVYTSVMVDGYPLYDHQSTVPATTGYKMVGPFSASTFNQPDGTVHFNLTFEAGVTVAVFQIS